MNCPRCNAPNPDGQRFCGSCGAPLPPLQRDPNYGYRKPEPNPNSNYNYSYGYQQQSNQNFSQQNAYYQPPQKQKVFERTWFIVIMCICVPPIGIFLLWISKRPRNTVVRVILTIFLVFYFMICFGDLSSSDSDTDSNKNASQGTVSQEKTDNDSAKKNSQDEQNQKEDIKVGSTFEIKGLKITINNANTAFTNWGQYDSAPADGMKYIMVNFTFENVKTSGDKYVSIYDFDCYADNATCDQVYLSDDSNFVNTNLSPGRNVTFSTYYTVPENAASIELEYHENMIGDEKTKIIIQ